MKQLNILLKRTSSRLRDFFYNMSIANKFFICFTLLIAVPIICGGIYIFLNIKSYVISEYITNKKIMTEKMKNGINEKIWLCRNSAFSVVGTKEIVDYVNNTSEYSLTKLQEVKAVTFAAILGIINIKSINYIRIFADNDKMIEIPPMIMQQRRLFNTDVLDKIDKNGKNEYWIFNGVHDNTIKASEISGNVIYYYKKDGNNYTNGFIIEVTMLINGFITDLKSEYNQEGIICKIVDSNIFTGDYINNISISDLKDPSLFQMVERELEKKNTKFGIFKINGNDVLIVREKIDFQENSYLYSFSKIKNVTSKINNIKLIVFFIIFFSLLVFSFVTREITILILKRMNKVVIAMKRVGNGDMLIHLDKSVNDEIGVLISGFNSMTSKLNQYVNILIKTRLEIREAEIKALLSQIDSHFLYNVLDAIKSMAEVHYNYEVADSLILLAQNLRYNLDWTRRFVHLKDELDYVRKYVDLMNLRYENSIDFKINVDDRLQDLKILKMIIQPFVENAIVHGFGPRQGKGTILLKIYEKGDFINFMIADNGVGIEEVKLRLLQGLNFQNEYTGNNGCRTHIGIKNIYERLRIQYGEKCFLNLRSSIGLFTAVTISIPLNKEDSNEDASNCG